MVKISYDIPKEMIDAAQTAEIQAKPFNLCFYCPAHNITCNGPNEMAMTTEAFVDRANRLAKAKNKTRATIAVESNLPEATVVSVLSKRTLDPRHSTMQGISNAVNGVCLNGAPCYMAYQLLSGQITPESLDADEETLAKRITDLEFLLKEAEDRIHRLENVLANIHTSYKSEMDEIRAKAERIADYLKQQIEKQEEKLDEKDRIISKLILDQRK